LHFISNLFDNNERHYNLEEMAYLETLYGHQSGVTGIDCHRKEMPISTGRDRTARAWKLSEDTHLIFRGGSRVSAADCVSVIKDDWFMTGHDDGGLSLWMTDKKRAVASIENAHAVSNPDGRYQGIISVNALKNSDIAATGSNDGYLRLWKVCEADTQHLAKVFFVLLLSRFVENMNS
jgi:ribosomal RNA-processing protein 9